MDIYNNAAGIERRKIALIGDRAMCRRFYLQFCPAMDIRYLFFTNLDGACPFADSFFKECQDVRCMALNGAVIREQKLLLILCAGHMVRMLYDDLLLNMGLEWGEDYVDLQYVIQYCRYKYNIVLEKKNIWIFGAGNNGRYFYDTYKDIFDIKGFISNFDNENECNGLPVIRPTDIRMKRDFFIVICSDADQLMAEQLEEMGLIGGKDYGFGEMLPKKLFIAMGICQIKKVAETLSRNSSFHKRYWVDIYLQNSCEPYHDADGKRIKEYGIFCDVVFYNVASVGLMEIRDFEPVIDRYYQNALRLRMPFYYFKGQLMQATDSVNPYAMREIKVYGGWLFWFNGDKEINRMVENNIPIEEMIDRISDEQYWTVQSIRENFFRELKKIEILDRFSSFPIRHFIEENYKKILIFIDGIHFSGQLCMYLANEIAKCLGIEAVDDEGITNEGENVVTGVMPVYPCVRRALGMERGDKYQYYNIEKNEMEYLDMREYARRYIYYVMNVRKIREESGTVMAY